MPCHPAGNTATKTFTLSVNPADPLVITTSNDQLTGAKVGVAYDTCFASGGVQPWTRSTVGGTLSPGLSVQDAAPAAPCGRLDAIRRRTLLRRLVADARGGVWRAVSGVNRVVHAGLRVLAAGAASHGGPDNRHLGRADTASSVWPARVDLFLEDGLSEEEFDRWVRSACLLCCNGCGCDIAVKDGRIGVQQPYFKTSSCQVTKVRNGDGPAPAPSTAASTPAQGDGPPAPAGPPATSRLAETPSEAVSVLRR